MTTQEAADALGIKIGTLRGLINKNRIPAERHDGRCWVSPEAVEAYRQHRAAYAEQLTAYAEAKAAKRSVTARFWRRVDKTGDCWIWQTKGRTGGYGHFHANGRTVAAHRFAYELTYGPIPEGMFVCHRCDNPPCVNPAHLFLGTAADNVADRDAKGRARSWLQGQPHPARKLTVAQAQEIRALYAAGVMGQDLLARKYNVGVGVIFNILQGRTYRDAA